MQDAKTQAEKKSAVAREWYERNRLALRNARRGSELLADGVVSKPTTPSSDYPTNKGGRPKEVLDADGQKIKRLRGEIQQKIVARLCKISVSNLQRAEAGRATTKTLEAICKWAKAKGHRITPQDLIKSDIKNLKN